MLYVLYAPLLLKLFVTYFLNARLVGIALMVWSLGLGSDSRILQQWTFVNWKLRNHNNISYVPSTRAQFIIYGGVLVGIIWFHAQSALYVWLRHKLILGLMFLDILKQWPIWVFLDGGLLLCIAAWCFNAMMIWEAALYQMLVAPLLLSLLFCAIIRCLLLCESF